MFCNLASLALKFKETQDLTDSEVEVKWEYLMHNYRIVFEDNIIEELKEGLELGWDLNLPIHYCCHYEHLSYLFSGQLHEKPIIRPFKHLMYV